jgi:hypothetical protein
MSDYASPVGDLTRHVADLLSNVSAGAKLRCESFPELQGHVIRFIISSELAHPEWWARPTPIL